MAILAPHIIFEDTHLLVIDKPAGLLSQGERTGDDNLVDWLRQYLGRPYVGLVHRLDRNTSGLMVVAKRTKSAQRLTESLQKGELEREYLAWLVGELPMGSTHRWSHWLLKDGDTNRVRVVARAGGGAKEAVLYATAIARGQWEGHPLTLTELKLETGRSHQIRVQSSYAGYPVLGDSKYGASRAPSPSLVPRFERTALHSHRLRFPHPMAKTEWLSFESPLPEDLSKIARIRANS